MKSDAIYQQIEEQFKFKLPVEYRFMRESGWFNITREEGQNVHSYPANYRYLWLNGMEWMPLQDICGGDDIFFKFTKGGLVPFAFDGGGSHWCWYPEMAAQDATPIVFCPRDSTIGTFYAPTYLGSLYREILSYASTGFCDDEPLARQHFKRWLDYLGPMFPAQWQRTLANLLVAPQQLVETSEGEYRCFLTRADYNDIVSRDLAFDKLDEEFTWMRD